MADDQEPDSPEQVGEPDPEDGRIFAPDGAMNPNNPLLARVQARLKEALLVDKQRTEELLREQQTALKNAKSKREAIGVELYGFQQNLAKLQLNLEQAHQNHQVINQMRTQAEMELQQLRANLDEEEMGTKSERTRVEGYQSELDRLSAMLKQIEQYNEQMKSEIAVTRRAAYAAEEAVQRLEKDKIQQDYRIDTMQENLKGLQQQYQLYAAQLEAQKRETRAALETLAEAEAEMESVHFEKKQLVAQWKSSLLAISKRDEALSVIQDAIREQDQQELNIINEIEGYKKDITKEQVKNEQMTAILRKVEAESGFITKQIEAAVERQGRLQEVFAKLAKSLEHTEEQIKRTLMEQKALTNEQEAVDRAYVKVGKEITSIEDEMLQALSEQTTAEKSSSKTASDIQALRKQVHEEELHVVETQNELAKLQVDMLNTEAHNTRLAETLKLLDEELADKARTIDKYELEIKRRNDEIEKKTREIDMLNRRFEKMVGNMEDSETGPLEATIKNLQREIDQKGVESKDLQRRWIGYQTELVALQNDNSSLTETVARMRAEHTVLFQRKRRLEQQYELHQKEIKGLQAAMGRLHVELQRVNSLIADNSSARQALQEDNFNLESVIGSELRSMEEEAVHLQVGIDETRVAKRDILAEIVEVERQIMLWERKIQLEKEMQEVLDPTVGQDVVGEMKKEIHRMQLRHGELQRLQEKLLSDMERALSKRELIGVKGRATLARSKVHKDAPLTRTQLDKAVVELQRSIKDTERELQATDRRLAELDAQRQQVSYQAQQMDASMAQLRDQEEALRREADDAGAMKYTLLLATAQAQRATKRLEDVEAGRHRSLVADPEQLPGELDRAQGKLERVIGIIEQMQQAYPQLAAELGKVLAHVAEV